MSALLMALPKKKPEGDSGFVVAGSLLHVAREAHRAARVREPQERRVDRLVRIVAGGAFDRRTVGAVEVAREEDHVVLVARADAGAGIDPPDQAVVDGRAAQVAGAGARTLEVAVAARRGRGG